MNTKIYEEKALKTKLSQSRRLHLKRLIYRKLVKQSTHKAPNQKSL